MSFPHPKPNDPVVKRAVILMLMKQITHANRSFSNGSFLILEKEQQEEEHPLHPQQCQPVMNLFVANR